MPNQIKNVLELINWAKRNGRVSDLMALVKAARPNTPDIVALLPSHHIPYRRNELFTGREEWLSQLYDALHRDEPVAVTQAVAGLGGVGKTQLALAYCYRHLDEYDLIQWLRADDITTLGTALAELAYRLGLARRSVTDQPTLHQLALNWLHTTGKRWLLVYDHHDLTTWENSSDLLPHLLAAADEAEKVTPLPEKTGLLLNKAGFYLHGRGAYVLSLELFKRALAIDEKALGPDHPDVAIDLNNLGQLLKATGEYEAARPYMERALEIDEKALGPDHPSAARDLNNLGNLLQEVGDYEAARPYMKRALAIFEAKLGPEHPQTNIGIGATHLPSASHLVVSGPKIGRGWARARVFFLFLRRASPG